MKNKIKILYIIPAEGFGGAERQAILHIRTLPRFGIDVVTVTGPGKKVYDHIQGTIYHCPNFPSEYGKPFRLFPFIAHACRTVLSGIRSYKFLAEIQKKERVDLVFGSRVAGWLLAALLSRRYCIPCVWRFGSRVQGRLRRGAFKAIGSVMKPAATVSNCKAVEDSIGTIISTRRFIVPNGIDCRPYSSVSGDTRLRDKLKLADSVPIVGLAVRPSPDKGLDFLAEIISVIKDRGFAAHFCIAGEFGWRSRIEHEFNKKGLSDFVSFLGHVEDMVSFYSGCDIVALTSRQRSIEGLPNSLLEAMALTRPVIATAVGGVPELIEHDKTGILVKELDPRIFAEELIDLMQYPEKRKRLGSAAGKAVRLCFSMEPIVQTLATCIKKVLDDSKPRCRKSAGIPAFLAFAAVCPFTAQCEWNVALPIAEFKSIDSSFGKTAYYSIATQNNDIGYIHAHYLPPGKGVQLGYQLPDSLKNVQRISWKWRVITPPLGADERKRGKNDSGAGVYLVFKKGMQVFIIKYVYSTSLSPGTIIRRNPFDPIHKMFIVVVNRWDEKAKSEWQQVTINVQADFKRIFNSDNCPRLQGVGILSDGDQTQSEVQADYEQFDVTEGKN